MAEGDEVEPGVSEEQVRAEEEALRRGWQAKRLLEEPMIVEAFATIDAAAMSEVLAYLRGKVGR